MKTIFILIIMLNLFTYCSTLDLKKDYPDNVLNQSDLETQAKKIIQEAQEKQGSTSSVSIEFYGTDIWKSWFVWLFTPCTEMNQEFHTVMDSKTEDIVYTYQNGRKKGESIGIKNGQEYSIINGSESFSESSLIRMYLRPLFNYVYWSHRITNQKIQIYLGDTIISHSTYSRVYVSPVSELSDSQNQYIIYINKTTGNIDFIEFTLRELLRTYKGVLRYKSYRKIEGIPIPFEIEIADSITSTDFVHKLVFSNIHIKK
jgi:hypothetical protein